MSRTDIRDAIDTFQRCPSPGPRQLLMVRVLEDNQREFEVGEFLFTVSMFVRLNVRNEDDNDGIWTTAKEHGKRFTLAPTQDGLELRKYAIPGPVSRYACEADAADLIRDGIAFLQGKAT